VFSEAWRKPQAVSLSHAFIGVANHGTQSSKLLDRSKKKKTGVRI
jgi:hypothetical protein